ncbi:uncharacterized protein FIBRA_08395 [Fibroporia radiculosa]|uniref:Major facilitator superfamily (MFS) profile domain-containing protein n=1 Tax=Fibroporia radiculosa TaxID=599839 RepID=J4ICC2_9APHY|nr:uncharacterized protein FIBRA_08395 [Fibroporia radiculosa]CCM06156.1 predicted protein [Fibroporia radiculosa]
MSDSPTHARSASSDSDTVDLPSQPVSTSEYKEAAVTKDFGFLPIPKWLRHDPEHPPHFGLLLNVTFGLAGTFVQLADTFKVSYDDVSRIPTLIQVGYAIGLLSISPLGDLVRRRPLILMLVFVSASLTIALAITKSLAVFEALSFLVGMFTVVPQILLPLVADLAPPHKRGQAMSIVLSGLLFGILLARVISGTIAQYVTWRVVYYLAIGLQYFVFVWLYLVLPDYPVKGKGGTYLGMLFSMFRMAATEPLVIQIILISIPSMACYTNFWVTLTFLLGGPPYNYSTLVIGLFGLVGMVGVAMAPLVGRACDNLVPWFAAVIANVAYLLVHAIAVGADGVNIAAVVIVCIGIDVFRQMTQVSLTAAIFTLDPAARSRLNGIILISLFIGQIMGTSVGAKVYTEYGWRPAAAVSLAWSGFMLLITFLRGPHVPRYVWFGYEGGIEVRKRRLAERERQKQAAAEEKLPIDNTDSKEDSKEEQKAGVDEKKGEEMADIT